LASGGGQRIARPTFSSAGPVAVFAGAPAQSASGLAHSKTLRAVRGASVNAPAGLGLRRQAQRDPTYQ